MNNTIILKANIKRHKITMMGIFTIMLMVSLTLFSVLTIWLNTNIYVTTEMDRLQYGDITAWTQGIPDQNQLYEDIERLPEVEKVSIQQLIYSDYQINGLESDSEGQLIVYDPQNVPYRIFNGDMDGYSTEIINIETGEIYISPALLSTFNIAINDEISFAIGRAGNEKVFIVKGMYEDPFMGSSMIGMKGFLIGQDDYEEIADRIDHSGVDALARTGQMFHIKQRDQSALNPTQFNQLLNNETNLNEYTSFVYSKEAITGFMLILQNAFTGLFLSFALILLFVSLIIVSYSISAVIEQDRKNMAILKTVGYDGTMIRQNIKIQYLFVIITGMIMGLILSLFTVPMISTAMISFAGIKTPADTHIPLVFVILLSITLLFYGFIHFKTRRINTIPPVIGMQNIRVSKHTVNKTYGLQRNWLMVRISLRQLSSEKRRYISVGITAVLLVFFVSMIGRMNLWLGPNGKGMMDAFNPADLDIGIQLLGSHDEKNMEKLIQNHSVILDSYALAMPNVSMDGVDYTANVITETDRFHIQQGATVQNAEEIVITETIAADRSLSVNDQVNVSYNGQTVVYRISGIYQCANEMGGNIGMSQEGFQRIGKDTSDMWCHHYFLEDTKQVQVLHDVLKATYGGDVYIHENTWPGLYSIITAMQILMIFMYVMTAIFILIVTTLTGHKIFLSEKRNLSIYKTLGFTTRQLRFTFAIRYGIIAGIGSMVGILWSSLFTDTLVGTLMKWYGISNFSSDPGLLSLFLPAVIVSACFILFAYMTSKKMKYLDIDELVSE